MVADKDSKSNIPPRKAKVYHYPLQKEGIKLREVRSGYLGYRFAEIFGLLLAAIISVLLVLATLELTSTTSPADIEQFLRTLSIQADVAGQLLVISGCSVLLVFVLLFYLLRREAPTYLVDFQVFIPPEELKVSSEGMIHRQVCSGLVSDEAIEFQKKVMKGNGLGEETYFPEGIMKIPCELNMAQARNEAEQVMFGSVGELLKKTGVKPKEIDILVVNCSLFNPTPSLSAMIINHFKMRKNIESYNLSGMGCSAGIISIHLVKRLFQTMKNVNAVVVSTENITQNFYTGDEKSMLVQNTLFRMGGAAIFLTNKRSSHSKAKYKLLHTVRTNYASDDDAFHSVYQLEDSEGLKGVRLSKAIMKIAGDALKSNITTLAPLILPVSEQLRYFLSLVRKKVFKQKIQVYVPDFKKAVDHFCIHAGGRAVIDALEENLKLTEWHVEPSRATLYRFGNTSSSSVWYELNFIENDARIKRGEKVWQIALGSGFKCNSAVWKRL